jgi:hypothetical protein
MHLDIRTDPGGTLSLASMVSCDYAPGMDASATGAEVLAAFGEHQTLTILRILELPDDARVTASSMLVGSMGELEISQFLAAVEAEPTGATRARIIVELHEALGFPD